MMDDSDRTRYSDFDALIARHQGLIRSLCWWYGGGDAVRVADLMQDVLLHLWHYRHTLREGSTPREERAWVRVRCRSVVEHQRRRPQVKTVPLEAAQQVAADDHRDRDFIESLATDLTAEEHRLLELVLDGYTDGEIGEALQVGTVKVRRLRATMIEKMKKRANPDSGDSPLK